MKKKIFKCYGLTLVRNTNKYTGLLLSALGILVLFACGGGGDGGVGEGILPIPAGGPVISSEDDVTLSKLVGTYILMDFEATYANGDTLTWDDVSTISGTMIIKSNGEKSASSTGLPLPNHDSPSDTPGFSSFRSRAFNTASNPFKCMILDLCLEV